VLQHAVDGLEVLFRLIVQLLRLGLEFLESTLRVAVDWIFRVFANVELGFELLRRL
jgi:hypothetical protein